eukprot:6192330-Pleurochrysis_carterae.AAC.4
MADLDLVIYGSTGFTGSLAATYVNKKYGKTIKWAIAGRSEQKLLKQQASLDGVPKIIVADSADEPAIKAMVSRTKTVVTFAGPFARYGTGLVKACAEAGTGYCDITGEVAWVRRMITTYDETAQSTGARIVHLCGHDSVPWDLMTLMLTKKLRESNDSLARVDMWDDIKSAPSGGTLETAFGIMFGTEKGQLEKYDYDPLLKTRPPAVGPSENKISVRNVSSFELGKQGMPHRAFFFMAGVNALAVKRSNALLGYGANVVYSEGMSFGSIIRVFSYLFGLMAFGIAVSIGPIRQWMLRSGKLPKPGEGPVRFLLTRAPLLLKSVPAHVALPPHKLHVSCTALEQTDRHRVIVSRSRRRVCCRVTSC